VDRTEQARLVREVLVATTIEPADDPVEKYCRSRGISYIRGSQFDVLDRYRQAAQTTAADIVVRVTADCPAIDPELIDDVVRTLIGNEANILDSSRRKLETEFDFTANRLPPPWKRTFPIGLDVEACTVTALEQAWNKAREPQQREHVMPFLYEGVKLTPTKAQIRTGISPQGFRVALIDSKDDYGTYRWTVDTMEDLIFMREVYRQFGNRLDFSWQELLKLVNEHPELARINMGVKHKTLHDIDERAIENNQQ
jgi:spore coat polysaccharide biosynthesis protein SpsF